MDSFNKAVSSLYSDADPKMEELMRRLLREAPAWGKMDMLGELNAAARLLALNGLRQRYPGADEDELCRRLASLLLGEELACKVYGKQKDVT